MARIDEKEREAISIKELFLKVNEWYFFLLSKWKLIFVAGLLGSLLGLSYSFLKKPKYTASLSFALESDKAGGAGGGVLALASQFGLDLGANGGGIFEGTNLIELFKSRTMVELALMKPVYFNGDTISLAEMYIQNKKWRDVWSKKPKFAKIQFLHETKRKYFTRVHDSILGVMYADLSKNCLSVAQRDKKVSIITMEVVSNNELFSLYFCENLAKQVGQFYISTKSKKARANMEILVKQSDSIRQELNYAISGLAAANDNTFNLNPARNIQRVPSARKQVDVQANTAILTELVKQTELAKVALRRETPLIQVLDRPILPLAKERFGKLKGIVLGGVLGGILIIIIIVFRRILKEKLKI